MKDICILYHYHRVDDLTLQHLNLIKEHNPDAIVISVTNDIPEYLPDSVDVRNFSSVWNTSNKWHSIDTTFYLWFLNREISARRYLIMEYDCRCTLPIKDAYAEVWDASVSCRSFYTPQNKPNWAWFKKKNLNQLPRRDRPYAAGVVPYAGTLISHDAAERILDCISKNDVFCELRLGTAINKAGLNVVTFPNRLKETIYATTTELDLTKPGIYHPVKAKPVFEEKLRKKQSKYGTPVRKIND
ncbi:MAG: hypothetical protein SW833_23660 [Cyanobacteriota bacterium]|nr:hypothetical protein [Cyanobacteriota bacterium]